MKVDKKSISFQHISSRNQIDFNKLFAPTRIANIQTSGGLGRSSISKQRDSVFRLISLPKSNMIPMK